VTLTLEQVQELLAYNSATGAFIWRAQRGTAVPGRLAGSVEKDGYRRIKIYRKHYQASHLAWLLTTGTWPQNQIDHINGERDDNRIANLREATSSQNHGNSRFMRNSKALYKGITAARNGRWVARIGAGASGRQQHLGTFDTPEAAHNAYCEAAQRRFGEFWRPA